MSYTIYSKDNCPACITAVKLVPDAKVLKLNVDYTKEELLVISPCAKSLPQVLYNGELLGGLAELKTHMENKIE